MTSPPADDYELGEFTKAVMRRAHERYQTNAMTHAEVELTINMLITEGKLASGRLGMIGFVREATALAILIHDELFDEAGNVKIDFPRTGDRFETNEVKLLGGDPLLFPDLKSRDAAWTEKYLAPAVAPEMDSFGPQGAGKHAGITEAIPASLTRCRGFVPMAGFGETRCKSCGRPKDQHPVKVQP